MWGLVRFVRMFIFKVSITFSTFYYYLIKEINSTYKREETNKNNKKKKRSYRLSGSYY